MRLGKKLFTVSFAVLLVAVGLVYESSAQRRGAAVGRPGVTRSYGRHYPGVRRYPRWGGRYWGGRYWSGYWPAYYDSFYFGPYFYYDPYMAYDDYLDHLERELEGNRRELAKHERKYRADGVITEKEQRELDDDHRDVQKALDRLKWARRNY